jgi:hypothetical protein
MSSEEITTDETVTAPSVEVLQSLLRRLPSGVEHLRYHIENVLYPKLADMESMLDANTVLLTLLAEGAEEEEARYEFLTDETADEIDSALRECIALLTDVYPTVKEHRAALMPRFHSAVSAVKAISEKIDGLREADEEEGEEDEDGEEGSEDEKSEGVPPVTLAPAPAPGPAPEPAHAPAPEPEPEAQPATKEQADGDA